MGKIRVFIADDHTLFRQGIAEILKSDPDFIISGETESLEQLLSAEALKDSDVLTLDISFGEDSSLSLIPELKKKYPDIGILILSMHNKPMLVKRAVNLGASGYCIKNAPASHLLEAIKAIGSSGKYFDPALSDSIYTLLNDSVEENDSDALYNLLTNREQEIFRLLAEGCRPAAIARELNISRKTAENHRSNILNKLRLDSILDLTQLAAHLGVI